MYSSKRARALLRSCRKPLQILIKYNKNIKKGKQNAEQSGKINHKTKKIMYYAILENIEIVALKV